MLSYILTKSNSKNKDILLNTLKRVVFYCIFLKLSVFTHFSPELSAQKYPYASMSHRMAETEKNHGCNSHLQ